MYLTVHNAQTYCYTGGKPLDAAKPTVVFIHGVLNDHSVWILQSRYLANHGYNVLAVDLPGHCRSAGEAPSTVEEAADFIAALLDAAGVERAALVGHSWGSLIALEAAARLKERITRLVLVGTAFPMYVSPALIEASLIFSVASIIDAISNPLMGYLTDNFGKTRLGKRFGRRRFFLLIGIPLMLFYPLLWIEGLSFWYYLCTYVVFEIIYTSIMVPYETLATEMTDDFSLRSKLTGYKAIFGKLANFLAAFIPGQRGDRAANYAAEGRVSAPQRMASDPRAGV